MKKIESRNERQVLFLSTGLPLSHVVFQISVLRSEHSVEVRKIQQKHDDEVRVIDRTGHASHKVVFRSRNSRSIWRMRSGSLR